MDKSEMNSDPILVARNLVIANCNLKKKKKRPTMFFRK